MAFQAAPNVVGAYIRGTFQGKDVENTFYYKYTGTLTQSMVDDLANALHAVVVSDWLPLLSSGYTLRETYVRDLAVEDALQKTVVCTSGCAGAQTGDTLPNQATIAIARRSGLTGRSTRGRIFWPGLREADVANNTVDSTFISNVVAALEALDVAAIAEAFVPVILSRYTAGAPRAVAVAYEVLTWLAVDALVDSRRSRKPKA